MMNAIKGKRINPQKLEFVNRELSWLSFNDRVLQEAHDPTVPLIERLRFMGIFSSNLDEFFRVRVASINRLIDINKKDKRILGYSPQKTLKDIKKIVLGQQAKFEKLYKEVLLKELADEKIFILDDKQLNVVRGAFVKEYFKETVLPALVPIMLEKDKPFPFLRDKSIYLFIKLLNKDEPEKHKLGLIEVPTDLISRFLILPDTNNLKFIILLEDVIRYCLDEIFKLFNYNDYESYTIKLTRDAELDFDLNDLHSNIVENLSKSLKQRKKGKPVRFVYDQSMPKDMLLFLKSKLNLFPDNIIPGGRYHNFKDFIKFPDLGNPQLVYPKSIPLKINNLSRATSMFAEISKQDYMVHTPYQSFDYVIQFLREAAIDPKVEDIKISLYRLAKNSRIINVLINAARNGKNVTVILELKARFDEENNIGWNQKLIDEGVKVTYGIRNKKVHSKLCLITRNEKNRLVYYANLSTGNFNEVTSGIYCDHSLFTCDKRITVEVARVFHFLEKGTIRGNYKHLLVAPLNMRRKIEELIEHEISNAKAGIKAGIIIKLNNLVDQDLIHKLAQASTAGVKIKLIIRGICCLIPGVKGFTENIEAISIVDKYLEHTRAFIFEHGGKELTYISSADWMVRNLDMRAEVAFPIYDIDLKQEIKHMLELQWKDNTKARVINKEQNNLYKPIRGNAHRSQLEIYQFLRDKL